MNSLKIFILFNLILLAACNNDDDKKTSGSNSTRKISGKIYIVSYYWDKDKDETIDFQGYNFTFGADGKLIASKNGTTTNGTWLLDTSDDDHDHLIISLGLSQPLEELNDDWEVVEISESAVKVKDESGSGGTEILNFNKK